MIYKLETNGGITVLRLSRVQRLCAGDCVRIAGEPTRSRSMRLYGKATTFWCLSSMWFGIQTNVIKAFRNTTNQLEKVGTNKPQWTSRKTGRSKSGYCGSGVFLYLHQSPTNKHSTKGPHYKKQLHRCQSWGQPRLFPGSTSIHSTQGRSQKTFWGVLILVSLNLDVLLRMFMLF